MANPDRARKLLVRSALATSATIATFVGAQTLAMLDARQMSFDQAATTDTTTAFSSTDTTSAVVVQKAAPELMIQSGAPQITILRQAVQNSTTTTTQSQIKPVSAQVSAPVPVVVRQPVRQTTRSSRRR